MENKLILDTSSKYLVVGLVKNGQIFKTQYEAWQRQSEFCIQEIDKILKTNNLTPKDINTIVVSIGPGSYTGIRIALTIAKVWSIASKINVITLSSLESLSNINEKNITVLDAKANRFYVGVYDHGKQVVEDKILTTEETKELIASLKDYKIVGETIKLGIEEVELDIVENMNSLSMYKDFVKDIDSLVPIYMKSAL